MRRSVGVILAAVLVMFVSACDINDMIDNPPEGTIIPEDTVVVSGHIPDSLQMGGTIKVNGVTGTLNADRTWSAEIPMSPTGYVTVVEAIYTEPGGTPWRQQTAVVHGPKIDEGVYSPDGVGLRFTNGGLAGLGPVIQDLAGNAFDIGALLAAQNPLIQQNNAFLTFDITGNSYESGLESVDLSAASTSTGVQTNINIRNLYVGVNLTISDPITFNCKLEVQIPVTSIAAKFDLQPAAADPSHVDVNLVGSPTVDTGTFGYEFISGICDGDVFAIGDIVNAVAGPQVQSQIADGFGSKLGDPDGSGPQDSPIADAIETALAEISIAGAVGDAIHANLDAPFTQINETSSAIDMRANADFFATTGTGASDCQPPPGAPDLASTFDVPGPYPTLGGTSPGGDPYGLGLVISASAFNQLLGAMTECGMLNRDITEISLGGGPAAPITAGLLSLLIPQFGTKMPASTPIKVRLDPYVAPFVSDKAGPSGETAELNLADLHISFIEDRAGQEITWLDLGVDAPLGFELAFDEAAGELAPTITAPPGSAVTARVLANAVGADEAGVEALFPNLFPTFVGGLTDSFGAFPLPSFLGLELNVLEIARQGNSFVLYANLDPIPKTHLENVVVTDLSTADSADDDTITDSNEWRHRLRKKISSSSVRVDLDGVIGADAISFADDEEKNAHAGYRVTFGVVPANGETWRLNLAQTIAGAHTLIDEALGSASTAFTTSVTARARIGSGAWQNFNFNPSVMSTNSGSNTNAAFSGSNSLVLQGTTAETITFEIGFDVRARSESTVFPPKSGDEAAIRFGANDTLANDFTAGEYPGPGNRNIVTDGHVGTIVLTTV